MLLIVTLLLGDGCDQLGNPAPRSSSTNWASWRSMVVATRTRLRTVPAKKWEQLLDEVPNQRIHHVDHFAAADGWVTLVTVEPDWKEDWLPSIVVLETLMELNDGRTLHRRWKVPSGDEVWFAAFAVPSSPKSAITRVLLQ